MKWFGLFLVCLLIPIVGFSQESRPGNPQYKAESDLLVLRFVPGDRRAQLFLAGNEKARLNYAKDAKVLSVIMKNDERQEVLKLSGEGESYEVESPTPFPKKYQVIVKTEVKGKVEEVRLKIDRAKP